MFKYDLYEIGRDWNELGTFVSSHKTKDLAEKRLVREAKKKVKKVYYLQTTRLTPQITIYDYGLWNRFYKIVEEYIDENNMV